MQTFNLDLSNKLIQPLLNAKQGEVGRKFKAFITDGGVEFLVQDAVRFSVWYSGEGGAGNYTDIGGRSAFSIDGNAVIVELITEMLNLPGKGELCLTMDIGGVVTATWNIPYFVEAVPGTGSKTATQYFNIMKESAERAAASAQEADDSARRAEQAAATLETDKSLSAPGVAADAAATGEKIAAVMQDVTGNREKLVAANIVCDAVGEVITLKDASDLPLVGLKIYGKTTQDGTPTPDLPVKLANAGDDGVIMVMVTNNAEETQSIAVQTPNGLPGIRVANGGNYTDAGGQHWVCDEVDFGRGVYVQRVGRELLNGSENWRIDGHYFILDYWNLVIKPNGGSVVDPSLMSNVGVVGYAALNSGYGMAYAYGYRIRFENMNPENNTVDELKAYLKENPIEVLVPLKDSTENELSADELATYVTPRTNKPNTTIYNDAGTGMKVSYVADTKAYIDNKFNELAAAIINNT